MTYTKTNNPSLKGLPKSVKIGAHNYKFFIQSDLKHDNNPVHGLCERSSPKTISLDDTKTSNMNMSEVVLHEILHAIWQESSLVTFKRVNEESVVDIVGINLTVVMQHNPLLVNYFTKQWKKK